MNLFPGYTVSISVVEIMTKNTLAGCVFLCYTVVYLCCMVLGIPIAPILFNAPRDTSGVGFQRLPVNISTTCDRMRGIVVNKFWLILCVPIYICICVYNVYLKVSNPSPAPTSSIDKICPFIDTAPTMASDDRRKQSWLRSCKT